MERARAMHTYIHMGSSSYFDLSREKCQSNQINKGFFILSLSLLTPLITIDSRHLTGELEYL